MLAATTKDAELNMNRKTMPKMMIEILICRIIFPNGLADKGRA